MVCYFHEYWNTTNKKEDIFSQVSYSLTEIFSDLLPPLDKWISNSIADINKLI
jgi:hypothetical protein